MSVRPKVDTMISGWDPLLGKRQTQSDIDDWSEMKKKARDKVGADIWDNDRNSAIRDSTGGGSFYEASAHNSWGVSDVDSLVNTAQKTQRKYEASEEYADVVSKRDTGLNRADRAANEKALADKEANRLKGRASTNLTGASEMSGGPITPEAVGTRGGSSLDRRGVGGVEAPGPSGAMGSMSLAKKKLIGR